MNVLSIVSVFLFIACDAYASKQSIHDKQRVSYGVSVLPTLALHRADMLPPKPMSICCPKFKQGEGLGIDASVFAKYVVDYHHSFAASFGYRDIGAVLSTETVGILNARNDIGTVRSVLETNLSILHFQLLYNVIPFHRFELTFGFSVGVNASKNYSYQENILSGNQVFDNGTQQRNTSLGALAGINPRYFGLVLGTSYRIPLIKNEFFIQPKISFTYAQRQIQFGTHWFADAMTAGIGFEYFPFGEIQKPSVIPDIKREESISNSSEEHIRIVQTSIIPGSLTVSPQIQYIPFLDIVYPDIILNSYKHSVSGLQCIDDDGSCHYPLMMDTLSRRMQELSSTILTVEISKGMDSIHYKQVLSDIANTARIDSSRIVFRVSEDPITQKVFRIKDDDLIKPFQKVFYDTLIYAPKITWVCESKKPIEFDWALLDLETDAILKKGKGISNSENMIDSIPMESTYGLIRIIVNSGEQKKIYQSEITVPTPLRYSKPALIREIAVLFDSNGDKLRSIDMSTIQMFSTSLNERDTITIEAFTDLSGDIELNSNLAKRRADSVAAHFPMVHKEIILSPLKRRNSGKNDYQRAYNRIVTIKRK